MFWLLGFGLRGLQRVLKSIAAGICIIPASRIVYHMSRCGSNKIGSLGLQFYVVLGQYTHIPSHDQMQCAGKREVAASKREGLCKRVNQTERAVNHSEELQ